MGLTDQWVDDCVDLHGLEAAVGKTVGHDLLADCLTLPVLLAARSLEDRGIRIFLKALQAGHLPLSELQRLSVAVRSRGVMQQIPY